MKNKDDCMNSKNEDKSITLYKCKGKDCPYVVAESELEDHIKTFHPNFYNLMKDSLKEGMTKKMNFKIMFKKISGKRMRE